MKKWFLILAMAIFASTVTPVTQVQAAPKHHKKHHKHHKKHHKKHKKHHHKKKKK